MSAIQEVEKQLVINEYNKLFQFNDSDLNLISSDGVHFKIHKCNLQSFSPVFQGMFEAGDQDDRRKGKGRLQLTDDTLENGKIISVFLRIIYGIKLDPPSDWLELHKKYEPLAKLFDKYDVIIAREHLCICFTLWAMTSKFSTDRYLLLGSQWDRHELVIAALKNDTTQTWQTSTNNLSKRKALVEYHIKGENTLNLASWSLKDFRSVSTDDIFLWLRAKENVLGSAKAKIDYKAISTEFEKLLNDLSK
ncbi:hypothetical protein V865_005395 [Kwoniella europaea PYCC6329]|uniref:BTB domain-containing protein n=1 Tax=Kwoniella europaea PYCC6329 TaxID=1423913 RepID=A0AAX4KND6_9TREE